MRRRAFLAGMTAVLPWGTVAHAQRPVAVRRIGYLAPGTGTMLGFHARLRTLGWTEGENLAVEYRRAAGRYDRLPALAAELVRLKVELIVAVSTPAARAAKAATAAIPIVFVFASEPVATGLVTSLSHPGHNVTGVADVGVDLVEKRLALLKEMAPTVTSVAVLGNPASALWDPIWKETVVAAHRLRVELVAARVTTAEQLEAVVTGVSQRAQALVVVPDAMLYGERKRLAELAKRHRLPSVFELSDFVEAGGLVSYGPTLLDQAQRTAVYVDRILRGKKPADLPVEQPTTFELAVNLRSAKALGLTVPPAVVLRADRVIE